MDHRRHDAGTNHGDPERLGGNVGRLLQRYSRMGERCQNTRPSRDEFAGMNNDSIQAVGLMAWWPIWEPMANAQKAPQAMDHGPYGMHMTPSVNTLHAPDPMMGTCWLGSVTPAGVTGLSSWQSHSRPYAAALPEGPIDPVDFGALPNATTLATAYMSTGWFRTSEDARRYRNGAPLDVYIYTFDRNDSFGFPGHNLGLIMRIPNGGVATADAAGTMYDNDAAAAVPFGVQTLRVVNDDKWHLLCGIYVPIGFTGGSAYGTGLQYVVIDGNVEFIGGNDNQASNVAQPFGFSASQVNMGSPQDAGHAAGSAVRQFIGCDDDGVSSPFVGYIGDHRLYSYDWMVAKTNYLAVVQFALQQAKAMYAPETRWELYRRPRHGPAARVAAAATAVDDDEGAMYPYPYLGAW
jgi:hypothetical protein